MLCRKGETCNGGKVQKNAIQLSCVAIQKAIFWSIRCKKIKQNLVFKEHQANDLSIAMESKNIFLDDPVDYTEYVNGLGLKNEEIIKVLLFINSAIHYFLNIKLSNMKTVFSHVNTILKLLRLDGIIIWFKLAQKMLYSAHTAQSACFEN